MAQLGALISFTAGTPAVANDVNYNFNLIRTFINSANFGVDNITSTLASRSGSPILTINQVSEPFSPLYIINAQNKSGIQIDQQVSFDANHGGILINDTATQTNASTAALLMHLSNASTNSAILIKHGGAGGTETFKLTKSSLSLFAGVVEFSESKIKLPIRDTAQQNAITQEGAILYNSDTQSVNVRNSSQWVPAGGSPVGSVVMYAGSTAPSGWLICNGDTIPNGVNTVQGVTANFSALYAIVGSLYGSAGKLPDLRGIVPVGSGTNTASTFVSAGKTYNGGSTGTYSVDTFGSHDHVIEVFVTSTNPGPITGQPGIVTAFGDGDNPFNSGDVTTYSPNFSKIIGAQSCNNNQNGRLFNSASAFTTKGLTSGGSTNTKPATLTMNYIIKY